MKIADFAAWTGRELAPSAWIEVDQARIDAFADCTGDHQFIHVDPARAARETPWGGSIAHGFLTLSLLAAHRPVDFPAFEDLALTINYGLDRVRFLAPVPAGSRVRLLTRVLEVRSRGTGRWLVKQQKRLEIEGQERPGYEAEQLTLFVARHD